MRLRPRQEKFVNLVCEALNTRKNTLGVAPTGAGKTVMLSAVAGRMDGTGLVLQHRDELVTQNAKTFHAVNPGNAMTLYTAGNKRWARERGGWTFGMIQTVANALEGMPAFDNVIVDEAHHISSNTYLKVIAALRTKNPNIKVLGVTATPIRGDKKTLASVFDNVADVITIRELIDGGFLVKPKTFVVDVGVQDQLRDVRKLPADFDMDEVARIMDHDVVTEKVVESWKEKAGNRQTVIFAATVAHAEHVREAFASAGVAAAVVNGSMADAERKACLASFDAGRIQVVINVAVLTEGWDCQPVSCVVLLRPSSYKSTMIQMIGRGLRPVDPERYPGVIKHDCIVLDFGTSILMHGSIETDGHLGGGDVKDCPGCNARVPGSCRECPVCGFAFPMPITEAVVKVCKACGTENAANAKTCKSCGEMLAEAKEREALTDFVMTEIELFAQSPFAGEELWPGVAYVCTAFEAWAAVVNFKGEWFTVGGSKEGGVKALSARTEKLIALAAGDDHMRKHGSVSDSGKTKQWLSQPATEKQVSALKLPNMMAAAGLTRYRAACLLTWRWSEGMIRRKIEAVAQERMREAA